MADETPDPRAARLDVTWQATKIADKLAALGSRYCFEPVVDVLPGLVLGDAIPLLDFSLKLFASATDDIEIIVGQPTPLLSDVTFELLPISLESIPIHHWSSL